MNALRRMQKLTGDKCKTCPSSSPHRCCDDAFCKIVERGLKLLGLPVPVTGNRQIRFMGLSGCAVPAEHRPGCTGYVCERHLQDRTFRREWGRLQDKYLSDPTVRILGEMAEADAGAMLHKRFGGGGPS